MVKVDFPEKVVSCARAKVGVHPGVRPSNEIFCASLSCYLCEVTIGVPIIEASVLVNHRGIGNVYFAVDMSMSSASVESFENFGV